MASPAHRHLLLKSLPQPLPMRMCAPTGGLLTALAMVFEAAVAFAPIPRIIWEHRGEASN